jgi:glycogen debranching enzyme
VSREWCTNDFWGGYVLFDWDTFFCAMMATLESPELSKDNFRAILGEMTQDGFVPNFGAARTASNDRSQPPVGAYCILKVWRSMQLAASTERRGLLEESFNRLLQWHRWWLPNRDGNNDGLLEWGSNPLKDPLAPENHTLRAAMFESGLDNSPMYDEAVFNPVTHTMELSDVGLNALYALDAWALSEIAAEIGRNEEARVLHEEYVGLAERINRELWNEADGIYQNRRWDGQFSTHLSPTNFYPLIAGIVSPERAKRMIHEHLLNEKEFWGEFVLPSISRNDAGYRQKEVVRDGVAESMSDYWRGRIWGPMNFLVSEGLRRYGFDAEAHLLARKSVKLFLQEWGGENHVHENYNDLTGEGDDVPSANALYHWGALLAYMGIQELVDCEPWNGWRFGNIDSESALVEGIQVEEGRLVVQSGGTGLKVSVDQRVLLETDKAVIVRGYRTEPGRLQFRLSGEAEQIHLRIGLPGNANGGSVKARTGQIFEMGHVQTMKADLEGIVEIDLHVPSEVEITW